MVGHFFTVAFFAAWLNNKIREYIFILNPA
jgi:hypothetical protein